MKLSIIIPCLNEERYIEKCILSVLENDFPHSEYELIIVDGMSSDKTRNIVESLQEKYSNIRLLANVKKTAPTAMNLGIAEAQGNIVMRMDAHSFYPKNYISALLEWKEKLKADNIGAQCETDVIVKNPTSIAIKNVLTNKLGVGNGLFRLGVKEPLEVDTVPFGCYSKDVLIELGGYDERLKRNQDIELNKRLKAAGKRIFLIPYTHCVYYARETWRKLAKNNYENGKWNLITTYYTKKMASLSIRHFIPLIFVLSIVIPALLSFVFWPFALLSLISLGLYVIALILVISKMDRKGTTFIHLLWTFLVLHISYGIGSFIGLFHIGKLFKK
ncbi:MAG: glycosyltransferase family 2 protein [Brumimicrobium sp.]